MVTEIPKIKKALTFEQAQNAANRIIKKEGGFPVELLIHPDGTWTFTTENSDICGIKETGDIGTIDFTDEYIGKVCRTEYVLRNKTIKHSN
jgi:predicted metalloprotease